MRATLIRRQELFLLCACIVVWHQVFAQVLSDSLSTSILKMHSLEELMEMDITIVSKRPEPWFNAPAAVHVITSEDIRRSGASSIPEALRLANNLHVAQKGSRSWGISARGFNTDLANKLLVLIDGRTVYTPLYSGVFWDRQDYLLNDIDRIEIISGPGSTLWGANAVNGVINIITKHAADAQGLYTEAGGGSALRGFAGARYGGMLSPGIHYRIYGKYFDRADVLLPNGNNASDSWQMGQGGFRLDAEISPENRFTFQGDVYTSDQQVATGETATVSGGNILSKWTHTLSDNSEINLQLYYDRTQLYLPTPPFVLGTTQFTPAGVLQDDLDTYDLDVQHRFRFGGQNTVVWGLGYRFTQDVVSNSPALGFLPPLLDQSLFSCFVQDEVMLTEEMFFTLGTKVEHNDYTGWEYEPSTRLQWIVTPVQMIWAAVSRAVRMPSRIDRDMSQPAPPYFLLPPDLQLLVGGSDFRSETVIAYETGYRSHLASEATASISAFYNRYDDIRSTSLNAATTFPLFFENNLEGETYGVELSVNYQALGWWLLSCGYNVLKEDIRIQPGKSDFNKALNETSDPQQQLLIRSSMNLREDIELHAALRWIDILHNFDGTTTGSVPSYVEMDIRIGWHPTEQFEFAVVGQNLFSPRHPEYGFPRPTRGEIERSVYGKISFVL